MGNYNKLDHKGNAEMARFMGYKLSNTNLIHGVPAHNDWSNKDNHPKVLCDEGFTRYHSSWNWLMPVVEKCFDTEKTGMLYLLLQNSLVSCNIDKVHAAALEIIEYDRENNHK